jgi:hypothetical protein
MISRLDDISVVLGENSSDRRLVLAHFWPMIHNLVWLGKHNILLFCDWGEPKVFLLVVSLDGGLESPI